MTRPPDAPLPHRGPGPVAAAHRVLIVSALLCAFAYAGWELRQLAAGATPGGALRAALALLAAGAIGVYLRSLRGLGAKLTPRDEISPPQRPKS